jgi:hypothetical protein
MIISGSNRVIRGGSWNNDADNARSANRNNNDPDNRNDNIGFRLASTRLRVIKGVYGFPFRALGCVPIIIQSCQ